MTTRVEPLASSTFKVDDVDESKCREWCSKNQDPSQKPANCTSYSYNDETRRCKLYSERTYPDGALERRVTSKPKRLFEKYCMPENLAKECGKRDYLRVDEMLLSGFAQSTAIFKTLAECMNHCIQETTFKCKSAMYFYEEGECITNLDTVSSNNTLIHVEDDDRVVFMQNDCLIKEEAPEPIKQQPPKEKSDMKIEKPVQTPEPTTVQTTKQTPEPTTTQSTTQSTTTQSTTHAPTVSSTNTPPTTIKTTKLVEMIHNEEVMDEKTEAPAVQEKSQQPAEMPLAKKPTQSPETQATLNDHQESILESPDFSLPKPSKQAAPEATKVIKTNNVLNEFKLAAPPSEEPSIVPEENRYFTAWSNWSPCSNIGERRIRRRKCIDFKKCKGSLMQIEYCPPELIIQEESVEEQPENDSFARGPVGPVHQPLPVAKNQAEDGSGSPPSILPPQLPKKETEPLPEGAPGTPEDIWSPWLGVCQHFVSTQPCKNGQIIGFESRECIAKDPQLCKGPFFRYCTLPCNQPLF
ncbi:hypothetical protein M3Y97_00806300 [Aphelenchoides bicaudatus]|nr:hypothetical protein M3Y97_00806300 [Aphelenchoides bicaudatus]